MSRNNYDDGHTPTQAQLDDRAARMEEYNQHRIAEKFQIDKDGKWLGFIPIPAPVRRVLGPAITYYTTNIADNAGHLASSLTQRALSSSALKGRLSQEQIATAGKVAHTGVLGLTLGMDLLLATYALIRDRSKNYLDITSETKQIADEVGAAADNKIIGLAFSKYHSSWGSDIKTLIPSGVKLLSTLPYAAQKYGNIWPESQWAQKWSGQHAPVAHPVDPSAPRPKKSDVMHEALAYGQSKGWSDQVTYQYMEAKLQEHGFGNTQPHPNEPHGLHGQHKDDDILKVLANLGSGSWRKSLPIVAGFFEQDIEEWATKKASREKPNTLELIEQLNKAVKSGSKRSVHQDVMHIFQQYEMDIYHKELTSAQLAERTKPIADAIMSGKLAVRGLVRLVGEEMVVTHHGDGYEIKSEEEIARAVQEISTAALARENEISRDKFMSHFERAASVEDTIQKNLADFKGMERDLFITLMPLDILERSGLSKKEIRESRMRAQENIYDNMAAAVLHLASRDEAYLQEHGLSLKEVKYLQAVSERVQAGDMKMLHELVDNKKQGLQNIVAAGLLAEQADLVNGDKATWSERVKEGKSLESRIETMKEERAAKMQAMREQAIHRHAPHGHDAPPSHAEQHAHMKHDSHTGRHQSESTAPSHHGKL